MSVQRDCSEPSSAPDSSGKPPWKSPYDFGTWDWAQTAVSAIIATTGGVRGFVKRHPYMAFGVAGALGIGLGTGSAASGRTLRMALLAAVSLFAVELARCRASQTLPRSASSKGNGSTAVAAGAELS